MTYEQERVQRYLLLSSGAYLADCLDMVSEERIKKLYDMIEARRRNRQPKHEVAALVADDVAMLICGHEEGLHMDVVIA